MRQLLFASAFALSLAACGGQSAPAQDAPTSPQASTPADEAPTAAQIAAETQKLNDWFEAKYEDELQFSPISLSYLGRKEKYDQIDDVSIAAADAALERLRTSAKEMQETFDYDRLSDEGKLSYDLWLYQLEREEAGVQFRKNGYIFEQMGGAHAQFPTFLINIHNVETEQDMVDFISRVKAVEPTIDELIKQSKESAEYGVRPPRFAFEKVIFEAGKIVSGEPFDSGDASSIWTAALGKIGGLVEAGTITEARADELKAETEAALNEHMKPAYERLIVWLKEDMPNAMTTATGVGGQPNGEAYYAYRLQQSTTTTLTPDEVHKIGLDEVTRIRAEMEAIKEQVGFDGTLQDFFALIRDSLDDERFYYPDTDEGRQAYIDDATAAIEKINEKLPEFFGTLPQAELVVKRVEPFREQDGAAQHYVSGTPDGARPGTYYAHLSDMKAMPKNQLEVIAYHEGNPGHHMQISIAQELEDTPTFRTQIFFGAYTEGWALYSELLAKEMGGYQDPYADFGRLTTEMWRAIRLVVDTGLHSKGWTEQEAIDYFTENSPEPLASVTAEVQRYIVWPGQATSYKIGMIKIQELRDYAETELGDDFDIRAFHDVILGGGALPLDLLDRRVKTWVADQKQT